MPMNLSTVVSHVKDIPNEFNKTSILEFYEYMRETDKSPNTQKQMLIALTGFARHLGPNKSFYDIIEKEEVKAFLDSKIKSPEEDPDRKSITTWNDYRWRIIYFGRWLYNYKLVKEKGNSPLEQNDWTTPNFLKIGEKRTKRLSPYSNNEIWEKEEYLSIIKYEPSIRNKAALMLLWDFSARNHEVVLLKIKNITLNERYGEGEVPSESKTGTGPIMLSSSFPYVRDWLNEHPFRNEPNARLICNELNGAPITPDRLCAVFKELKQRIAKLVASAEMHPQERERLAILLQTKKWNPYCVRHSSLTDKADYLPEYALRKVARWSMNSRQVARYVKPKIGIELKNKILLHDGIINDVQAKPKSSISNCPKCQFVNPYDTLYCKQCSYPLTSEAYEKIKQEEGKKFREMEERFTQMEEQLKRISESNPIFRMPFENGCKEVAVMPVQPYIFPDNISEDELRIQIIEILQGKRKPNGPIEYKIVTKKVKEEFEDPKSQSLLLTNF